MSKLYLPPSPPNEGAYRLAIWMLGVRTPQLSENRIAEMRAALGGNMLDRLITGEVLPGMIMGSTLVALTGGRVEARQFQRPTGRRWSDTPGWDARHPEFR